MRLYIDKENIKSLIAEETDARFDFLLRMLKNNLDIGFNFGKEEIKDDDVLVKFISQFTSGRGDLKLFFLPTRQPNRPLSCDFLKSIIDNKRCIVLINEKLQNNVKKLGSCLIGGLGEEVEILEKLFVNISDYDFDIELPIGRPEFNSWRSLSKYNHPFQEIIILDRYILKTDEDTFKYNLLELLKEFSFKKNIGINIILITLRQQGWTFHNLNALITSVIEPHTGCKPNFTLVWTNDRSKATHDRHIITNYYWLKSGDSFNYFRPPNEVATTGDTLDIKSLAKVNYRKTVDGILGKVQEKIKELSKANQSFIEGERQSIFLKFDP